MKTFGRYLTYRLKQSWLRMLIFTVLSVIFTQNVMRSELNYEHPRSGLFILAVILGILCTVIPILEIAEYKNRRNLDAFYSFSISRKSLALLHFLCGWTQVVVVYTVTYLAGVLTLLTYDTQFLLIYLIPYYFCSLALGLIIYAIFLFLFNEGNTESDGVLFGFLGIFDTTQGTNDDRYYLLDLNTFELVGQSELKTGSGNMDNIVTANKHNSHATLSGFEMVGAEYYSNSMEKRALRLIGLEEGINDNAMSKGTVVHYTVNNNTWGCKGFPPVKTNGRIDKEATYELMRELFPENAIIYTHPTDERYWDMSELYA